MANNTAGIAVVAQTAYTAATAMNALFDALLAIIPNPDASNSGGNGIVAGANQTPIGAGFLDEMSPAAAVQLRVELTAMKTKANNTTIT